MKKPVALCLAFVVAIFACMCMCSGIAAIAGDDGSTWNDDGSNDRFTASEGRAPFQEHDHDNPWVGIWGFFAMMLLVSIVGGVIGMAFYASRRLPTIERPKRPSIII